MGCLELYDLYQEYCETQIEYYFTEFVLKTEKLITWKIRKYGFSKEDMKDIRQNIYIQLWQASSKYDPLKSNPKTFTDLITRRAIMDFMKKQNREKRTAIIESLDTVTKEGALLHEVIPGEDVESIIIEKINFLNTYNTINDRLSELQKEVFNAFLRSSNWKLTADYDYIQKETGYNKKQIDNALYYIRKKAKGGNCGRQTMEKVRKIYC